MLRGLNQLMERKEGGGADKTYYDLRDMYGGHVWRRIIATYISNCLTYLKVNAETSKTFGFIAISRDT
ncbi:hypothetical protein Tco_0616396 [Tanacetum coccineum]